MASERILEVCAFTIQSCIIAEKAGAVVLDEPGFHVAAMNEEFLNILYEANKN